MIKTDKDTIINFDFQSWPVHKMSLREFISNFMDFNKDTNKYEISNDNPILDVYPMTLEDDGMGYGVNEKYIVECDKTEDNKNLNIFLDSKLSNIELYLKYNYMPYEELYDNKENKFIIHNIKEENNKLYLYCFDSYYKLYTWVPAIRLHKNIN